MYKGFARISTSSLCTFEDYEEISRTVLRKVTKICMVICGVSREGEGFL